MSIYLPDVLYRAAQERKLPLSALTQQAVERALAESDRRDWVTRVRARPRRHGAPIDTAQLLDDVRAEFST